MSECQYPNGCLRDDGSGACHLCDEDGADRIAEYYSERLNEPNDDERDGAGGIRDLGPGVAGADNVAGGMNEHDRFLRAADHRLAAAGAVEGGPMVKKYLILWDTTLRVTEW